MKNGLAKGTASFPMELVWQMVTQVRTWMRHEIIGRDNRSTCHNSVRKGEFLSLRVSGHLVQVQESHLSIQVRVPSESAK